MPKATSTSSRRRLSVNIEPLHIELDIRCRVSPWEGQTEQIAREINVDVIWNPGEETKGLPKDLARELMDNGEIRIGSIEAYFIDCMRAEEECLSLWDALDIRPETARYMEAFDTEQGTLDPKIGKLLDSGELGNVMIIHGLKIDPKFQGQDAGVIAMLAFMNAHKTQVESFLIAPFPLQFASSHEDDIENLKQFGHKCEDQDFSVAKDKLMRHYARLGFKSCLSEEMMICDARKPMPDPENIPKAKSSPLSRAMKAKSQVQALSKKNEAATLSL